MLLGIRVAAESDGRVSFWEGVFLGSAFTQPLLSASGLQYALCQLSFFAQDQDFSETARASS